MLDSVLQLKQRFRHAHRGKALSTQSCLFPPEKLGGSKCLKPSQNYTVDKEKGIVPNAPAFRLFWVSDQSTVSLPPSVVAYWLLNWLSLCWCWWLAGQMTLQPGWSGCKGAHPSALPFCLKCETDSATEMRFNCTKGFGEVLLHKIFPIPQGWGASLYPWPLL